MMVVGYYTCLYFHNISKIALKVSLWLLMKIESKLSVKHSLVDTICTIKYSMSMTIGMTIDMLFTIHHGCRITSSCLKLFGGWFIGNGREIKL